MADTVVTLNGEVVNVTPAPGAGTATAANQATMITSLQALEDLRNALDSVGTDELDVNVETSVLPTGAATQATLAAVQTAVETLARIVAGNEAQVDVITLPGAVQGPGNPTVDSYTSAPVNLAASTADQVLVAQPAGGKQIWVYGLYMMADTAAGTVALQDEDNTPLSGVMAISDEGGWVLPMSGNFAMPWIKVATAKALECDTGACTIDGIICYGIVSI